MKRVSLVIDGKPVTANEGDKLLWVALDNGIYIPNLCAIRDKPEPTAGCRLCFVEVAGKEQPVTACTEPVTEGKVVNTRGAKALRLARTGFELLMASHPVDCAFCLSNRACELQMIARHLGAKLKSKRFRQIQPKFPPDDSNPLFTYNPNKCVLCGRCLWVCREHLSVGVLGFAHRGFERRLTTFADELIGDHRCLECARCVDVCPTGALAFKDRARMQTKAEARRASSLLYATAHRGSEVTETDM